MRAKLNTGGNGPPDAPLRPPHTGGEPLVRPARGTVFVFLGYAQSGGRCVSGMRTEHSVPPSL